MSLELDMLDQNRQKLFLSHLIVAVWYKIILHYAVII
jgi:hypothetical protein